jgi:hypothetical protein
MIRFRCPHCDQSLKVSEGKAGATFVCPRCNEQSVVPSSDSAAAAAELSGFEGQSSQPERPDRPPSTLWDRVGALLEGMKPGLRRAAVLVTGVGVLSLLLAVVAPFVPVRAAVAETAASAAMLLVPSAVVSLLVMLYGHATCCPRCGKWWARNRVESEFVEREVFDKAGVPFARSTYRTTYLCTACRHKWSTAFTDEYKDFVRDYSKRRVG